MTLVILLEYRYLLVGSESSASGGIRSRNLLYFTASKETERNY